MFAWYFLAFVNVVRINGELLTLIYWDGLNVIRHGNLRHPKRETANAVNRGFIVTFILVSMSTWKLRIGRRRSCFEQLYDLVMTIHAGHP